MRMLRVLAAAVLVLALLPGLAPGEDKKSKKEDANTRTVQGYVLDGDDNPVSGAVVQLKDTKTLQVRSFITQDKGDYHFAGLSTNVDYELKADKSGQSSGTKTLSVFDSRKKPNINLKLK